MHVRSLCPSWHVNFHLWVQAGDSVVVISCQKHARGEPLNTVQFSSVAQSCLTLCNTITTAWQASLSITSSQSLPKLMSIELVMPSNHLILCCPLLLLPSIFPASESFQMSQLFASGGQNIGISASTSVLPVNIQDWFPLGLTGSRQEDWSGKPFPSKGDLPDPGIEPRSPTLQADSLKEYKKRMYTCV